MAAPPPPNDNISHALAGAGGGILSMILTYPLITLSTRAQVESRKASTSIPTAIRELVRREGLAGLYSGVDSAVFGIAVTNFVYYYFYEGSRSFFQVAATATAKTGRANKRLTTLESIAAGAVAGSLTVVLTNPIWVVNTRMTTRRHEIDDEEKSGGGLPRNDTMKQKRVTTMSTLLALLRNEGPLALFSGVLPALVLVINPILQYTLFEQLKNIVSRRRRVTPAIAFFLGALGKLFATSLTYPYITVKSQAHVAGSGKRVEGMSSAMRRIVNEEGYAGLYKGIGTKVTQSVLTAAFLFALKDVLYEQTVKLRQKVAKKALVS